MQGENSESVSGVFEGLDSERDGEQVLGPSGDEGER